MPSTIRVDSDFRSRGGEPRGAMDRALPHRQSYLGFALGLVTTVIVVLAGIGWALVETGIVYVQVNL